VFNAYRTWEELKLKWHSKRGLCLHIMGKYV